MLTRRRFLLGAAAGAASLGMGLWPEDGLFNPCLPGPLPEHLLEHDALQQALTGLDGSQVWDSHVHLVGLGHDGSGIWLNPDMSSVLHPVQWVQKAFYLNAACTGREEHVDSQYVQRLLQLKRQMPQGNKLMLLAFDYAHHEDGRVWREHSSFYVPNEYAQKLAAQYPDDFEWIASVHPYREDALERLQWCAEHGARAIKWLPPAMAMDPGSATCDDFYETMARLQLPLLTHAGHELAVEGGAHDYGNPLLLRRALDHGVKVLVAHCASLGRGVDLDRGEQGPLVDNFQLFQRLMDEPRYEGLLYGEISAITQINRLGQAMDTLLLRSEWHARLLNGSDYPLPGVLPLFSVKELVRRGYLEKTLQPMLVELRRYNPLLFDFVLKRLLRRQGQGFSASVFESGRIFDRKPKTGGVV